jgi:hypothetical protein
MMTPEEASPAERRKEERVRVNLKARWEGVFEQKEGDIVDVSASGCFILTAHEVKLGELIRLEIEPSVVVWGEVIYQIEEMGFALKFTAETGEAGQQLTWLVDAEKHRLEMEKAKARGED